MGLISDADFCITDVDLVNYCFVACDGLWDVMSSITANMLIEYMIGVPQHRLSEDEKIIISAIDKYLELDIESGDELLYQLKQRTYASKDQCKRPNQFMNKAEKMCCILTRIGYLMGSEDNLTAVLLLNESVLLKLSQKFG
jgi:hypothetical protein